MRVLLATAELAPLVRIGGLAYATAGLAKALQDLDVEVTAVLPDYGTFTAALDDPRPLDVPEWVGAAGVRTGTTPDGLPLIAVATPEIRRSHPYHDAEGRGWDDNDHRFMAFSAGVAALADRHRPDVLHLNDWHTAATLGLTTDPPPSVLTIHNLAYQGTTQRSWSDVLVNRARAYRVGDAINPMAGGIALVDRVVTVSPTYADEIRRPAHGAGLHQRLAGRGDALVGIRNGIDTARWSPATDPHLPQPFAADDLAGKEAVRRALLERVGWEPDPDGPVVAMVTRLAWQKGVDLALELVPHLDRVPVRMVLLGTGDRALSGRARDLAGTHPDRFVFLDGFDEPLAHLLSAGADLLLMPSRFEPCGLTQMQAMLQGTIPVVTDVGGLHDTVVDADRDPGRGTGFVAPDAEPGALLDALHRAVGAWRSPETRTAIQRRGMTTDWSWREPARRHLEVYRQVAPDG